MNPEPSQIGISDEQDPARHLAANVDWVIRLRWVAVAGQMVTVCVAWLGFAVPMRILPLMCIIGFTALTNVVLTCWLSRSSKVREAEPTHWHRWLAAVMTLDLLSLTGLLYYSGGTANPFSVFYLVNLALCAVILPERWGWILTAVAVGGLTWLVAFRVDVPELQRVAFTLDENTRRVTLDELGQLVAMVTCALVIILFVKRVTRRLEFTQAELRRVEREQSRSEKLEALGTLAAGAAHELATPLSTIAVVANEISRHLRGANVPSSMKEDVALIRAEVNQCHTILARMTGRAGQSTGDEVTTLTVEELVHDTVSELSAVHRLQVDITDRASHQQISVPRESVAQAIRGIIQNGLDATEPDGIVRLAVDGVQSMMQLVIQDDGPGMTTEVLNRAGEPFFTTKEPGRGMGLGLFLARSVVERLGGSVRLKSVQGMGVTVVVELPVEGAQSR